MDERRRDKSRWPGCYIAKAIVAGTEVVFSSHRHNGRLALPENAPDPQAGEGAHRGGGGESPSLRVAGVCTSGGGGSSSGKPPGHDPTRLVKRHWNDDSRVVRPPGRVPL